MTSGVSPPRRSSHINGRFLQNHNMRNALKNSGRRRFDLRNTTGPNNPCIVLSWEEFEVTDANFEFLQDRLRSYEFESLIGERNIGYRIVFPDTSEGQKRVEECYRSLSGQRLKGKIVHLRKFDSGSPVKNPWFPSHADHRRSHTSPLRQYPDYAHTHRDRLSGPSFTPHIRADQYPAYESAPTIMPQPTDNPHSPLSNHPQYPTPNPHADTTLTSELHRDSPVADGRLWRKESSTHECVSFLGF